MGWRFRDRLSVIVHTPKNPSNLEWQGLLRDRALHGRDSNERTLIVSYGGGPDADQRKLLSREMDGRAAPTVIMTKSAMVRAIASALLFFNRQMKVVGIDERELAYQFLGFSPDESRIADRLRAELELELGIAKLCA
ncbi:MAG TPA: hypothetical protein VFQ35_11325 [Polyangiaceae bacterium]|nr:hypothetical protein [Polyangiaceae bacterium]